MGWTEIPGALVTASLTASFTSSPALSRASFAMACAQPAGGVRYDEPLGSRRARRIVLSATSHSVAMSESVIQVSVARPLAVLKSMDTYSLPGGTLSTKLLPTGSKEKAAGSTRESFPDGLHMQRPEDRASYVALPRGPGQDGGVPPHA